MDFDQRMEILRVNMESLHATVGELVEGMQRHDVQIAQILAASKQDGENIRGLARIAEIHERRLSDLEGDAGEEGETR